MGSDFFISYTSADSEWAEWIAAELGAAGYSTLIQAWDFVPGMDFLHKMQEGIASARTVAVWSPDYFESAFAGVEWRAVFAKDPGGDLGLLVPVRVRDCDPPGMLATRVWVDLVGLDETRARERLLAGVARDRPRPTSVAFPGKPSPSACAVGNPLPFPGHPRAEPAEDSKPPPVRPGLPPADPGPVGRGTSWLAKNLGGVRGRALGAGFLLAALIAATVVWRTSHLLPRQLEYRDWSVGVAAGQCGPGWKRGDQITRSVVDLDGRLMKHVAGSGDVAASGAGRDLTYYNACPENRPRILFYGGLATLVSDDPTWQQCESAIPDKRSMTVTPVAGMTICSRTQEGALAVIRVRDLAVDGSSATLMATLWR